MLATIITESLEWFVYNNSNIMAHGIFNVIFGFKAYILIRPWALKLFHQQWPKNRYLNIPVFSTTAYWTEFIRNQTLLIRFFHYVGYGIVHGKKAALDLRKFRLRLSQSCFHQWSGKGEYRNLGCRIMYGKIIGLDIGLSKKEKKKKIQ